MSKKKKLNPYTRLAKMHSEGLEYIAKQLSNLNSGTIGREMIIDTICDFMKDVINDPSEGAKSMYHAALCEILNKEEVKPAEMSADARKYMDELEKINRTKGQNPAEILAKIDDIGQQASKASNSQGMEYVLLYTAVAKTSVEYWDAERAKGNLSFWHRVMGPIKELPWAEDAAGAVKAAEFATIEFLLLPDPLHAGIQAALVAGNSICDSIEAYGRIAESEKVAEQGAIEKAAKKAEDKVNEQKVARQAPIAAVDPKAEAEINEQKIAGHVAKQQGELRLLWYEFKKNFKGLKPKP